MIISLSPDGMAVWNRIQAFADSLPPNASVEEKKRIPNSACKIWSPNSAWIKEVIGHGLMTHDEFSGYFLTQKGLRFVDFPQ